MHISGDGPLVAVVFVNDVADMAHEDDVLPLKIFGDPADMSFEDAIRDRIDARRAEIWCQRRDKPAYQESLRH